jgi:acetoin utilization deacetylase AcuC-like enzyme
VTRPVAIAWAPGYRMPLGAHVFPSDKYDRVWKRCRDRGLLDKATHLEPSGPLSDEELGRVHTADYLARLRELAETDPMAGLTEFEVPCFPGVISAQATMARGTMMVTAWVLERGAGARGANLGGGFHHAFAASGQGFCLFNDIALSILAALDEKRIARPMVVDTDVHQGNGTCHIFRDDARVYTLDLHQASNYPIKQPASMNVGLPDECDDDDYADALTAALADAMAEHDPDFVHYVAGGDPFAEDQLGGLALTKEGLRRRDRLVLHACSERRLPVVATLAGGYAANTEDLVDIHADMVAALFDEGVGTR